jgi:hypothetical protein
MKSAILAIVGLAAAASAQTIFYGGDPDLVNGLSAEFNTVISDAYTFDDFDHPGGTIASIFGNYFADITPSGFEWEIRQGMSVGNGGALMASGSTDGSWTWAPNGFNNFGFLGYTMVADITDVSLPAGTYHLALSPRGQGFGRSFVQTTSGANSIGSPIGNGNSFFHSSFFGVNYGRVQDQLGFDADFSYGVNLIPAPASLALLGLGGLAATRRRR